MRATRPMQISASSRLILAVILAAPFAPAAFAQQPDVTAQIEVSSPKSAKPPKPGAKPANLSSVVIWLDPLDEPAPRVPLRQAPQIAQRNKSFEPHLLVVPVGTVVLLLNEDTVLHSIFSTYDGVHFNLGMYAAGDAKSVPFDRAGITYLHCQIHPQMSAIVVTLNTPYFAASDSAGRVAILNVPDGRYELHAWSERASAAALSKLTRVISISPANRDLGSIQLPRAPTPSKPATAMKTITSQLGNSLR